MKTTTNDDPDFVLTKQEYYRAIKVTSEDYCYLIYRYTNWGTDAQTLKIFDFSEMRSGGNISPSTYVCSTLEREPVMTAIRYYRERCGISKGDFADYLGIQTPNLWRYETGERRCSVEMYQRMAVILNTTIDELVEKTIVQNA